MSNPSKGGDTLLQHMGFRDPDRGSDRHGLACAYARTIALQLAHAVYRKFLTASVPKYYDTVQIGIPPVVSIEEPIHRVGFRGEKSPLLVGFADGLMHTTFWGGTTRDFTFEEEILALKAQLRAERPLLPNPSYEERDHARYPSILKMIPDTSEVSLGDLQFSGPKRLSWVQCKTDILLEVKITPTACGDVLRQMEAYRTGYINKFVQPNNLIESGVTYGVVLTDFPISETDLELYVSKNVLPLRLGPNFETFIASQQDKVAEIGVV